MLFSSDLMVLGTRYYHESGVPSYCALQHQGHNCFWNSSSTRGLSSTQQQARSSGFERSSATGRWEGRNMQRVVSRHTAVKLNQVLKLGFNPACSLESHHGWRGLGFSHNFALQAKDFSVRSLVGNSPSRVLGSLPGGQTGGNNGSSSVRISCSSVPHIRPPISRRSFSESRKLLTRTSRQQRSTSSRIGSTGDFSPEWLLEAAVDVLRNFNEKVNSLFQGGRGGGGGDGGSRDFATAAEEKLLTSAENGIREENVVPELVDTNQEQQGGEFEWRSALWEAEVSSVEELEAVAQKIEETTPTTVSTSPEPQRPDLQSPELRSPELQNHDNGNIISEVPIRAAQSSLPTEEREILQQESTADSPTGVVSGLGTDDEHTSSQLSAFHVPEPISLSEAADVEIRIDDKIEEAALAEGAVFENRELEHAENGIVVGTVQQEVSSAEIEQTEVQPVVLPTDVTGLGADGDISQLSGSVDPQSALSEAAVEIREEEMIEEEIIESTTAHRELEHTETGTMGRTIQVTESASLVEVEVAEEEALSEADVKIRAEVKIEESVTEAITGNPELDHPQNMEVGSTIQGSEGAPVEVKEVDIGELWNRNTSGYPPFTSFEPSLSRELQPRDSEQVLLEDAQRIAAVDSTEGGETLSLEGQVVAEEKLSLVGKSDGIDNAVEEVDQPGTPVDTLPAHDSLGPASVEIGEAVESSEGQVAEESVSRVGKKDEIENAVEEVEQRGTPVDTLPVHDSLRPASGESGAAVESSSFEGQTTLAGEAGAMEEVKQISEEFGEPFREQQDTADVAVATDSLSTDRNIAGTDDLDLHSEISRLRNSISQYAYRYHTLDSPVISDAAYDSLVKELVNLEAQVATSETSPSVGVAAPPSPDFLKVLHSVPMLSLASVQKEEEILLWYRKLQQKLGLDQNTSGWVVEPKVDGLALSLRYEDGILKRAATRGNGIQGEDVTHNAQRVLGIPLTIPQDLPGTECPWTELEVRGEIFMSLKDFEELNASKIQAGEKPFSNPRNAAAGSMRLLSSNSNELRPLSFMAYSVGVIKVGAESTEEDSEKSSLIPTSQWEVLQLLNSAGFPVNEDNRLCESFDSALEYAKSWRSMRKNLEYEADGVVLKVNDLETQASLGSTGTDPRWALAWKFAATEAVSVLEGIELTIGRSGAMIPNARLKPVELGGAVISRASLHNFGHVKALGLCEGDHVVVQRAGDVIPKVVQVLEDLRPETATPWVPPQECPACGSALTEASASAMIFCSNSTCPSRHSRQVGHFAKTLIPGLGSATLSRLEEDLVKDPADFYDLDEKSLSKVKGFGKQSIKKLLKSIEESKQQDLWLFIAALGIPKVGANTAKELSKTFGSLQALTESDASGFTNVPGIGPATASCIFDWCQTEANIELVHRLKEAGCKINGNQVIETHGGDSKEDSLINGASPGLTGESEGSPDVVEDRTEDIKTSVSVKESDVVEDLDFEEVIKTDESEEIPWDLKDDEAVEDVTSQPSTPPLSGKSIVITGDFGTMKREDMKKLVTLHGGAVRTSVTSKTSFLLCGNRPGPLKVAEASRRGVEMLDWQSFLSLIGQTESDIV